VYKGLCGPVLTLQVEEKDAELREMETRLESVAPLCELHQSVDSRNWSELSRLVDALRTLAARPS